MEWTAAQLLKVPRVYKTLSQTVRSLDVGEQIRIPVTSKDHARKVVAQVKNVSKESGIDVGALLVSDENNEEPELQVWITRHK